MAETVAPEIRTEMAGLAAVVRQEALGTHLNRRHSQQQSGESNTCGPCRFLQKTGAQ